MLSSYMNEVKPRYMFHGNVFSVAAQLHDPSRPGIQFRVTHSLTDPYGNEIRGAIYTVEFTDTSHGPSAQETLEVDGENVFTRKPHTQESEISAHASKGDEASRDIVHMHKYARRYRFEPRALRATSSTHTFVERDGTGLPSSLVHLETTDPASYDALRSDFIDIFPDLKEFRTVPIGSGVHAIEFDSNQAAGLSGANLSDGQALTLGLLFLAHSPQGPKLLLIDEPEITLSPIAMKGLLNRLDSALGDDRQVVTTTHSPYLMQWGIQNDHQVLQVRPDFGVRTWSDSLHQQGIDSEAFHSHMESISVERCGALLEAYLTG